MVFARLDGNLEFDVYLQLSDEKITKIFHRGSAIDRERLENYILRGIPHFLILKEERAAFMKSTVKILEHYLSSQDFSKEDAQAILDDAAEKILAEVLSHTKLSAESVSYSKKVVQSYVFISAKQSEVLAQLLKLAKQKRNLYRHSIMTAIFATLLARGVDDQNEQLAERAALGGFLHDLGLMFADESMNEHSQRLTPDLKKLMQNHSLESVRILRTAGIDPVVCDAVFNHHENWDGSGYPQGLKKREIPQLARILAVADQFAGLVNPTPESPGLTPEVAFLALKTSGKLDPEMCMTFGKILRLG